MKQKDKNSSYISVLHPQDSANLHYILYGKPFQSCTCNQSNSTCFVVTCFFRSKLKQQSSTTNVQNNTNNNNKCLSLLKRATKL